MSKGQSTKDNLLEKGRHLFWSRGYSAVSLRDIASAAGVDVALISRYFGGKQGLFEATLQFSFDEFAQGCQTADDLVDRVVDIFVTAPRDTGNPSIVDMLLLNAKDADVGEIVRNFQKETYQVPLANLLGDETKAAMFLASVLGLSIAEKTLKVPGIAPVGSDDYIAQVRHILSKPLEDIDYSANPGKVRS